MHCLPLHLCDLSSSLKPYFRSYYAECKGEWQKIRTKRDDHINLTSVLRTQLSDGGNAEFLESQCLFLHISMVCHLVSDIGVDRVVYSSVLLRPLCQDLVLHQSQF